MKYFVSNLYTKIIIGNLSATFCVCKLSTKIFIGKLSTKNVVDNLSPTFWVCKLPTKIFVGNYVRQSS